ncbi:MAG: hypothetical protein H0T76_19135 [Nannocystis sp.]|nr:hypothetical protein [Nannocystis sp.]
MLTTLLPRPGRVPLQQPGRAPLQQHVRAPLRQHIRAPLQQHVRAAFGLAVTIAGLFACSRAAAEPPVISPRPAPTGLAEAPEVHVSSDISTKPAVAQPLDARQRALFLAPAADEPAAELGGVTEARKGQHYVTGNERTLEAFYPRIHELGGAYVGVGSDQAYVLLGWSRAELAWLIDYDPVVVELHAVYHALFAAAATPERFLALWQREHKADAIAALHAAYPGELGRRREALFRQYRARVAKRLGELQSTMSAAAVPSFLNGIDEYTYVRGLIQAGRVRALLADLGRDGAVREVAAAARRLGTPVRVVYLSNAEQYWELLPPAFRTNLAALPVDERSVVLRTLLTWETNKDYRYNAQPARNYQRWLAIPWVETIYDVVRRKHITAPGDDLFETTDLPDAARLRRRSERRAQARLQLAEQPLSEQPPPAL